MNRAIQHVAAMSIAALLAGSLGACSKSQADNAAQPPAAAEAEQAPAKPITPEQLQAALMAAVFKEGFRPAKGHAVVDLPDPDDNKALRTTLLTPLTSTRLPTGEMVLVVNGQDGNKKGESQSGHGTPGALNLYVLRDNAGVWEVVKRHENVAAMGSWGQVGQARWVKQTNGKVLLAIESGGTWHGYTITLLDLFDPAAVQVRSLTQDSPLLGSGNEGGCGPRTDRCWDIQGKWHLAPSTSGAKYDDLVMVFSGYDDQAVETKQPEADGEAAPAEGAEPADSADTAQAQDEETPIARERKKVAATARYAFDKGSYRLKSGENPVPGI